MKWIGEKNPKRSFLYICLYKLERASFQLTLCMLLQWPEIERELSFIYVLGFVVFHSHSEYQVHCIYIQSYIHRLYLLGLYLNFISTHRISARYIYDKNHMKQLPFSFILDGSMYRKSPKGMNSSDSFQSVSDDIYDFCIGNDCGECGYCGTALCVNRTLILFVNNLWVYA